MTKHVWEHEINWENTKKPIDWALLSANMKRYWENHYFKAWGVPGTISWLRPQVSGVWIDECKPKEKSMFYTKETKVVEINRPWHKDNLMYAVIGPTGAIQAVFANHQDAVDWSYRFCGLYVVQVYSR